MAEEFAGFNGTIQFLTMHKFENHFRTPVIENPALVVEEGSAVPWAATEVFVDDLIAMYQDVPRIKQLTRSILRGIEQVFLAPDVTGHSGGREPLSEKKILRGEAD